ncbi:MAG: NAD(P)H-dependent oxidoreductase [Burkholderiaceae bacterium]|jgi:putative NADPH-quinone reductase|nr:NAD(P)H-dependent oxidoreductase [Aquabacterium sp.]NUP87402.1 NAD(P)H-dependent oxidoreductase [Burkholderiaceae bacterium]
MKCLVVIAHPVERSACRAFAEVAIEALTQSGHEVTVEDLYPCDFAAALTADERQSYYSDAYDARAVQAQARRLLDAQALVLVFPTWWFGFPAILKGWFDRVWAPGIAYDHASDLGPIRPRLHGLRNALAITTLGSPWWVDHLLLRQPVRRVLKTALLGTCAPACGFQMLSLYKAERLTATDIERFGARIRRAVARWPVAKVS